MYIQCYGCRKIFDWERIIVSYLENSYYPENGVWVVGYCEKCFRKTE